MISKLGRLDLRVLAGSLRGRTLSSPATPWLRPLSGRIKKSLFDILTPRLPGAAFLDLFSGSGAIGIEALSRGARVAVFVEKEREAIDVIKLNLTKLGLVDRAKALIGDATADPSWIVHRSGVAQFNIVFMGPPYKDREGRPLSLGNIALAALAGSSLLATGGIAVVQHHLRDHLLAPPGLTLAREEKYGDTLLSFFKSEDGKSKTGGAN
jgi:16S rRNA (guanine(966)-N(2))-methyltransferase RsmD